MRMKIVSLSLLLIAASALPLQAAQAQTKIGVVKEAQYGPIFGRNAKHLFVLTKAGPVESTDGAPAGGAASSSSGRLPGASSYPSPWAAGSGASTTCARSSSPSPRRSA